ncbi:hypothetical protein ACF8Q9_08305 [Pseudomonas sp. TYF_15]|uniref:hypothetical protein n=1 Tax=Pseudomonas sp. TYF_15 TaxID=3367194 RepID=UPI00370AFB08
MMFSKSREAVLIIILFGLLGFSADSMAECARDTIRDLVAQGKTKSAIADFCDMEISDVNSALKTKPIKHDEPSLSGKLVSGTPVGACGCWGAVPPGTTQPHQSCESGYAVATPCPTYCPMGGYQWRGVCQ